MKIAVPTLNGHLSPHFGHCQQFSLIEVDVDKKAILNETFLAPPQHEPGVLPQWLNEIGANVIIAGGMGQRAQALFNQHGVQVILGASSDTPLKLVHDLLHDNLQSGENLCDH